MERFFCGYPKTIVHLFDDWHIATSFEYHVQMDTKIGRSRSTSIKSQSITGSATIHFRDNVDLYNTIDKIRPVQMLVETPCITVLFEKTMFSMMDRLPQYEKCFTAEVEWVSEKAERKT